MNFWEDCFRKLKMLLAANRLIYLSVSMSISTIRGSGALSRHSFLYRITTSYTAKIIMICEDNYSR